MKKAIITIISTVLIFSVILFTSFLSPNEPLDSPSAAANEINMIHATFTESSLPGEVAVFEKDNGKFKKEKEILVEQNYEVWINEDGTFRLNYLSGPSEGDYMVWDGNKVYQYTKANNQLIITKESPDSNVVPHLIFSKEIPTRIFEDYKKEKIKKIKDKKLLDRETMVYRNEITFDDTAGLLEQYPNIYKAKNNKETVEISIDKLLNIALEFTKTTNGKITHQLKMNSIENLSNFDLSLLNVDESIVQNVINIEN